MPASPDLEKAALAFAAQDATVKRKKAGKEAFELALARFPINAPLSILGQQIPSTVEIREVLLKSVDFEYNLEVEIRDVLSEKLAAAMNEKAKPKPDAPSETVAE